MSDVGGCLGLYLGMSLLSFVHIIELIVDLIVYFLSQNCAACLQRVKVRLKVRLHWMRCGALPRGTTRRVKIRVSLRHVNLQGGSVAEWLACWTQAQKGQGSNRSRDAVG